MTFPINFVDSWTPTGALTEFPATTSRGINALGAAVNSSTVVTSRVLPAQELTHDFTTKSNGTPGATADTGQTWTMSESETAGAPVIASGGFSNSDTAANASKGQMSTTLGGKVGYLSVWFNFTAGSTTGQSIEMGAMASLPASGVTGTRPDGPQIAFYPGHAEFGWFTSNVYNLLGTHNYAVAYTTQTQYAEMTLDTVNGRALVLCPDGFTFAIDYSLISSVSSAVAAFGIYMAASNTDGRAVCQKLSAGQSPPSWRPTATENDMTRAQLLTTRTITASDQLTLDDIGNVVEANSAAALNFTIPPQSTLAAPNGSVVVIAQTGAGAVTLVPGTGVTLSTPSTLITRAQYSQVSIRSRAANSWIVSGDTQ